MPAGGPRVPSAFRRRLTLAGLGLAGPRLVMASLAGQGADPPLRFAAAASLRGPLDEVLASWAKRGGPASLVTYAGTPALVRQIGQGLPVDCFISADSDWMDELDKRAGLRAGSRRDLFGNRLVLVASPAATKALEITGFKPGGAGVELGASEKGSRDWLERLATWPGQGRVALAEVKSVPAGRYARVALDRLGLWQPWSMRLAMTDNVRAALLLVARGESDFGIVYASDARAEPRVSVIATLGLGCHPPIRYPAAVLAAALHPAADSALAMLAGESSLARFKAAGFSEPVEALAAHCQGR